jgi:cytochrome d ubiquinol oxidase subunit II
MRRWYEAPILMVFPIIGLVACAAMYGAIRRRRVLVPFACGMAIFAAAFATLAVSFYPYMIPFSTTISDAASPTSSLAFMFWGAGLFVRTITLAYTFVAYLVFKGKVDPEAEYR